MWDSIIGDFEKKVLENPDKIAVISGASKLTYQDLSCLSNGIASTIIKKKLCGTNIGISLPRSAEIVASILGVLKSGNAFVFIDPGYPPERQKYIMENSGIRFLICTKNTARHFKMPGTVNLIIEPGNSQRLYNEKKTNITNPSGRAYIMYTSGSTGRPKGVEVLQKNVLSYLESVNELFNISENDIYLQSASFAFSSSVRQYFLPLLKGSQVVIADQSHTKDLELYLKIVKSLGVTVADTTQSLWKYGLMQLDRFESGLRRELFRSDLRLIIFSGDMLPAKLVQNIRHVYERPPRIINLYGQTETIGSFAYRIPDDFSMPSGVVPIGYPLPGTEVFILDENGKITKGESTGEVCISSASISAGYYNEPELTAACFTDPSENNVFKYRTLRSGDIIRYRPSAPSEIIGRKDFQVKIRGVRIDINEIERVISLYPGVKENVVVAFKDKNDENRLAAFIIYDDSAGARLSGLRNHAKAYLPDAFIPEKLIETDKILLTPNGKTDRKALEAIASQSESHPDKFADFRNESEKSLYNLFSTLLNIKEFSVNDSFFDIGGHSLLAVELVDLINRVYNKKIPIDLVYKFPSIRKMSHAIEHLHTEVHDESYNLVAIQPEGGMVPFICVHGDDANYFLPRLLGSDIPFYGFFHQGRTGGKIENRNIYSIADGYVDELLQMKPEGPYVIGGYSIGGIIAAEMARILKVRNYEVRSLILIDTESPRYKGKRLEGRHMFNKEDTVPPETLSYDNSLRKRTLIYAYYRLRTAGYYFARFISLFGIKIPLFLRNSYIMGTYKKARMNYFYSRTDINAVVIRATDDNLEDADLGWARFIKNIKIVEVVSNHDNIIKEPFIREVASVIKQEIYKASEKDSLVAFLE
jgi:amino acid adenylation domain-containing protein